MITLLKYRVLFVTFLFGAFGGALSLLLKIEDLKTYYPSLAVLIALTVSLLISFLIKAKWETGFRNKLKIAATLLFVFFLVAAFLHTYLIINRTIEIREFDEMSRYVTGDYSPAAKEYLNAHRNQTDKEALYNEFGGAEGIPIYWTPKSINNNILLLIISYCAVILFFVACISLLAETLSSKYGKKGKKVPAKKVVESLEPN